MKNLLFFVVLYSCAFIVVFSRFDFSAFFSLCSFVLSAVFFGIFRSFVNNIESTTNTAFIG